MQVSLDLSVLCYPKTGIGTYSFNLAQELASRLTNPPLLALHVGEKPEGLCDTIAWEKVYHRGYGGGFDVFNRIWSEQVRIPKILKQHKVDLHHTPAFIAPLKTHCPRVVSIHDVAFLHFQHTLSKKARAYWSWFTRKNAQHCDAIIVPSEQTKKDLIHFFQTPEERMHIIPYGLNQVFHTPPTPESLQQTKEKFQLPNKFLLYVGTLEPRKNVDGMIEAYALLDEDLRHQFPFYIVGGKGWLYDKIFNRVSELGLEKNVHFTGYVSFEELRAFYTLATTFFFATLYEGLGLPPIEAMASGTPVVCSNNSALPEAVGDAAIQVAPYSPTDMAKGLTTMLSDPTKQTEFKAKGLERSRLFSWKKNAEQVMNVYQKVLQ
jgi:glycosyltransferase involved in cell wall biosynthesis